MTALFNTDTEHIQHMIRRLALSASELGLPFGPRSMTYNTRKAQELGLWAEEKGCGEAFHKAAFFAYFAEGRNLADHDILLDLAEQSGLSRDDSARVLATGSQAQAVDADWHRAHALQVTAVPTFILNKTRLVGAQPYSALQGLMLQHDISAA